MRTTLKIETLTKTLVVDLKLVDGKQIVELELSDLLALIEGKGAKASAAVKTQNAPKAPKAGKPAKAAKAPKESAAAPKIGAKRGRKPKAAAQMENTSEMVTDPTA